MQKIRFDLILQMESTFLQMDGYTIMMVTTQVFRLKAKD